MILYSAELGKKYFSPSRLEKIVDNVIHGVFKICQLDVKSGRLCDGSERVRTSKSELQFKALVSSITKELDDGHI